MVKIHLIDFVLVKIENPCSMIFLDFVDDR